MNEKCHKQIFSACNAIAEAVKWREKNHVHSRLKDSSFVQKNNLIQQKSRKMQQFSATQHTTRAKKSALLTLSIGFQVKLSSRTQFEAMHFATICRKVGGDGDGEERERERE
jgi:hypothetical protein